MGNRFLRDKFSHKKIYIIHSMHCKHVEAIIGLIEDHVILWYYYIDPTHATLMWNISTYTLTTFRATSTIHSVFKLCTVPADRFTLSTLDCSSTPNSGASPEEITSVSRADVVIAIHTALFSIELLNKNTVAEICRFDLFVVNIYKISLFCQDNWLVLFFLENGPKNN